MLHMKDSPHTSSSQQARDQQEQGRGQLAVISL